MKIVIVFPGSFPGGSAAANRIYSLSKSLTGLGDKVTILLPNAYEKSLGRNQVGLSSGVISNVEYFYTAGRRYVSTSFVRRILDNYCFFYIQWLFKSFRLRKNTDIIWLYSMSWIYILSAKILFKKVVYEQTEKPFLTKKCGFINKFLTLRCFRLVDGFLLISNPLVELFHKIAPNSRLEKIPTVAESFLLKRKSQNGLYMIHAGVISERKEGILTQIKAFHKVLGELNEPFRFIILGNLDVSPDKEEILSYISENHLEDLVLFKGLVDKNEVEQYMSAAALAVLHRYDNEQNRYGFSTKLAEYLFAGIPVLATPIGEIVNYFTDGENIIYFQPGDVKELSSKIRWCLLHYSQVNTIAEHGKEIAMKNFSSGEVGKKIHAFFESL